MTIPSSHGQAGADLKHLPPKQSRSLAFRQSRRPLRLMLGAGAPDPAMSAHLAPPQYVLYPGAAKYGDYYWFSAGSMDSVPPEEAPAPDALPLPAAKTPSPSGTWRAKPSGWPGLAVAVSPGLGGDADAAGGSRVPAWPLCPHGTGHRGAAVPLP